MSLKKILIIKTGSTMPDLAEKEGDFESRIAAGLGQECNEEDIRIVDVTEGHRLPDHSEVSAALITGSHDMVTDQSKWNDDTAGWLKEAMEKELPLLGICYGHQLLAWSAGGEVGFNPEGREFGTVEITLEGDVTDDPLLAGFPRTFKAHVSHAQSVLKLPENAVLLASSQKEKHQIFRIGKNCYGVQFHPEFNAAYTRQYVREFGDLLREEGQDPEEILSAIEETETGSSILERFYQKFCR